MWFYRWCCCWSCFRCRFHTAFGMERIAYGQGQRGAGKVERGGPHYLRLECQKWGFLHLMLVHPLPCSLVACRRCRCCSVAVVSRSLHSQIRARLCIFLVICRVQEWLMIGSPSEELVSTVRQIWCSLHNQPRCIFPFTHRKEDKHTCKQARWNSKTLSNCTHFVFVVWFAQLMMAFLWPWPCQ